MQIYEFQEGFPVPQLVYNQEELFLEDRVIQTIKPFREMWQNASCLSPQAPE